MVGSAMSSAFVSRHTKDRTLHSNTPNIILLTLVLLLITGLLVISEKVKEGLFWLEQFARDYIVFCFCFVESYHLLPKLS